MRILHHRTLLILAASLALLPGPSAMAETPAPELTLGYSSFQLKPVHGVTQRLSGFTLGGRASFSPAWSVEAAFNRQTGTESDAVNLRQIGLLAGPRYSYAWSDRFQGFVHLLVGVEQLHASDSSDSDQKTTGALSPGVGAEIRLNQRFSLRLGEDLVITRYAGLTQRNWAFSLALVMRR